MHLQESCSCCIKLAEAIPMAFHQQSESLAKPLLASMTHQHSRVRVACLKVSSSHHHIARVLRYLNSTVSYIFCASVAPGKNWSSRDKVTVKPLTGALLNIVTCVCYTVYLCGTFDPPMHCSIHVIECTWLQLAVRIALNPSLVPRLLPMPKRSLGTRLLEPRFFHSGFCLAALEGKIWNGKHNNTL